MAQAEFELDWAGEPLGAPAYAPRALLAAWLYGFMIGVRSCRKLEGACRDQIPFLWLTGWQHPDHNTLWRFYRAHRAAMRHLLKHSIRTAVDVGLVDLAVQAVDGTKVAANAAGDRSFDAAGLAQLLERTEVAIADLEAQNEGGADPVSPKLPEALCSAQALRSKVRAAMRRLEEPGAPSQVNLTDEDAQLMKGRQGIRPAYNAQAMVSPLDATKTAQEGKEGGGAVLITAAEVVDTPADVAQLVPMLEQAEAMTGVRSETTLADGGFHNGTNLGAGEERHQRLVIPEGNNKGKTGGPYFKDRFIYDPAGDRYHCPEGQWLTFQRTAQKRGQTYRVYQAPRSVCHACPAYGACTRDRRAGRSLWISDTDAALRRHRAWMATDEARALAARRKELVEPVLGILKEQQAAHRFLLRGLTNVKGEFTLLATAFNLRVLYRFRDMVRPQPFQPLKHRAHWSLGTHLGSCFHRRSTLVAAPAGV